MSETYKHKCSCGKDYTDNDPDGYFCPSCVKARKEVAKDIDKKFSTARPQVESEWQKYERLRKEQGYVFLNQI